MGTAAEAGRGYPSSIDTNGDNAAWVEWIPKPGRHSSWRIMSQEATDLVDVGPTFLVDEASDTRTGSLYDIASVLDLNGDAIAYSAGAPTAANPLASAIRYGNLSQDEPFHQFETDLVPYDIAIGESGVLFSMGAVNPEAFGEIVDPKLMFYPAGSDAPQAVAEDAFNVALDGDRRVWASPNQVITALVGSADQVVLSEAPVDAAHAAAAERLVAWSEAASNETHLLQIWDSETGATYLLAESPSPFALSIGGGWIAWVTGQALSAVRIEDLRAAF